MDVVADALPDGYGYHDLNGIDEQDNEGGLSADEQSIGDCPTDDSSSDIEAEDRDIVRDAETFAIVVNFLKEVHGMSRKHQDKVLQHINLHHKRLPNFPSNIYFFDKYIEPYYLKPIKHLFCLQHGNYVGIATEETGLVSRGSEECELFLSGKEIDRNYTGAFHTIDVEKSLRTYFESPVGEDAFVRQQQQHGVFDLCNGLAYQVLGVARDDVSITLHIDDGQAFGIHGSKNGSTMMVSFIINELPSRKRYRHRFLFGIAVGVHHPSSGIIMDLFAKEVRKLERQGFQWRDTRGNPRTTHVMVPLLNSDAQARWDVLGHSSFHAIQGCTSCLDPGERKEKMRRYPATTNFKLRSKNSVIECARRAVLKGCPQEGVRKACRLLRISSFCPVRGAPHDYMHSVALGQVKTGLMKNWTEMKKVNFPFFKNVTNSTESILGSREERIVDQRLLQLRFPSNFKRTVLPLSRCKESHASEHLNFLLYGMFTGLKDILPKTLYDNAMKLSVAIHLLLTDSKVSYVSDYSLMKILFDMWINQEHISRAVQSRHMGIAPLLSFCKITLQLVYWYNVFNTL